MSDQGYSLISDGCSSCRTDEIIIRNGVDWLKPVSLQKVQHLGSLYWRCPSCLGFYGEVA